MSTRFFGRQRAATVTRSSLVEDWMDCFTALQIKNPALDGHRVADEVALRMCRSGYSPADALERYLALNPIKDAA